MDTTTNNELPPHLRVTPFAPKTPLQPPVAPRSTVTRRGKIARLPHEIREALNLRLGDGELARPLLDWLNALPEVQSILAEQFDGRPITEQNLSEWRHGGYEDWEQKELLRDSLSEIVEDLDDLGIGDAHQSVTERFAIFQALALGRLLMAAMTEPVSERREQRVLTLVRAMNNVRRCDNEVERVRLQRERLRHDQVGELMVPKEEDEMREKARRYARWHEFYRQETDQAAASPQGAVVSQPPPPTPRAATNQKSAAVPPHPTTAAPASKSIPVHPVHPVPTEESKLIQPAPTNPQPLESQITPTVHPPVVLPGCGPFVPPPWRAYYP